MDLLRGIIRNGAVRNRNGSFAYDIVYTGHDVNNASSAGLQDGMRFPMACECLRRGQRDALRPRRLNIEHHRNPIHWLALSVLDTHDYFSSAWESWPGRTEPDQRVRDV